MNLNPEDSQLECLEALTEADRVARPHRPLRRLCRSGRHDVSRERGPWAAFRCGSAKRAVRRLVRRIARARSRSTRRSASPMPSGVENSSVWRRERDSSQVATSGSEPRDALEALASRQERAKRGNWRAVWDDFRNWLLTAA